MYGSAGYHSNAGRKLPYLEGEFPVHILRIFFYVSIEQNRFLYVMGTQRVFPRFFVLRSRYVEQNTTNNYIQTSNLMLLMELFRRMLLSVSARCLDITTAA